MPPPFILVAASLDSMVVGEPRSWVNGKTPTMSRRNTAPSRDSSTRVITRGVHKRQAGAVGNGDLNRAVSIIRRPVELAPRSSGSP